MSLKSGSGLAAGWPGGGCWDASCAATAWVGASSAVALQPLDRQIDRTVNTRNCGDLRPVRGIEGEQGVKGSKGSEDCTPPHSGGGRDWRLIELGSSRSMRVLITSCRVLRLLCLRPESCVKDLVQQGKAVPPWPVCAALRRCRVLVIRKTCRIGAVWIDTVRRPAAGSGNRRRSSSAPPPARQPGFTQLAQFPEVEPDGFSGLLRHLARAGQWGKLPLPATVRGNP